jgi:hypothetical protein
MLDRIFTSLDPASRLTVKRVAVTLAVAAVLALFAKSGQRLSVFLGLAGLAVFVTAALAMRARQRFNASELNHWDEVAFYVFVIVATLPLLGR